MVKIVYKKAQVTIFIIIAVLIVVAVGIVFVVRSSLIKQDAVIGADNIGDYVTNCLKITAENGLILIGRQGGYYKFASEPNVAYSGNDSEPGILFTKLGSVNIGYYFKDSQNIMPSKEKIQEQLSLFVEENLGLCTKDFSVFKQKGFDVTAGEINAITSILDEKVVVSLDYPVTAKKVNITQEKTSFNAEVPIRLGLAYNLTKALIAQQVLDPESICMTCMIDYKDKGFYTQLMIVNDRTIIFVITDTERKLNNTNYDFVFANKY